MKKPCSEEREGFKIEISKINIFLIALFLSLEVFPQDRQFSGPYPINGFCQFKSLNVPKNFNSLFTLNYNNDSYSDIVLYNPGQKKIVSLTGTANGAFYKPVIHYIPYQISKIQNLNELNKNIKSYAFISRVNMRAGIYSFTSYGSAYLSSSIKFSSYPGNISSGDIDKNGNDELLISGSSFDGLSIIYRNGALLKKKDIVSNINFSNAILTDLNNDGYLDIAAFNILDNSLDFYYNNSKKEFRKVRSIKLDAPVHNLHSVDMNLDEYADLIYTKGKSINIIYGDFASSYSRSIEIDTKYYPDQIITGDFNRDGKIDIAYINKNTGICSVIFAKTDDTYYPEIIYHKRMGIENIIPFYSKFISGIALIDTGGFVYTLTNLPSLANNVSVSLGAMPSAIVSFDDGNNGINDICFIDNYNSSLNMVVRNNSGIPDLLYTYPLSESHSKIIVENQEPRAKTFFCYSPGRRLIEILKADFNHNTVDKISMYSPGDIEDLRIRRIDKNFDNIYISYTKGYDAGYCIMEYRDYRYSESNYPGLGTNVINSNVTTDNPPGIIYWQKTNFGASLIKISPTGNSISSQKLYNFKVNNINSIYSYTGDLLNIDRDITLSFINENDNIKSFISDYKTTFLIKRNEMPLPASLSVPSQFYFGRTRPNGLKKLYVYDSRDNSIYRIDFIFGGKNFVMTKLIKAVDVDSFFIKSMSYRTLNVVYTDKSTNCINVKKL